MGVTISGSGSIVSSSGSISLGDDNLTTTGTIPAAQLTGTLPAVHGGSITALNAASLAAGVGPTARLGSGTASGSTFLAGDQTYKAVSSGLSLLETVTASNDAAVILDATAAFDGTHDSLLIVCNNLRPATDGVNLHMRVTTAANDPETGAVYWWGVTGESHQNTSTITDMCTAPQGQIVLNGEDTDAQIGSSPGSAVGESANFTIEFSQPDSTAVQKYFHWQGAWSNDYEAEQDLNVGPVTYCFGGGNFFAAAAGSDATGVAITKVRLFFSSGNVTSGTVRLYGRTDS